MNNLKENWQNHIFKALLSASKKAGIELSTKSEKHIIVSNPPNPEMGDLAFAMFPYAKDFKQAPAIIAGAVIKELEKIPNKEGSFTQAGPYINIKIDIKNNAKKIINKVLTEKEEYGCGVWLANQKIMIEFSCPNTNKPLHLGHLRNDAIGASIAKILKASGAEVQKVNLINDRGIHICKSMLAYQKFGNGTNPQKENIKSDHFVGNYYVKFDTWSKQDETAIEQAQKMLQKWENGDPETTKLWKQMNKWTIDGIEETYQATGISFDKIYFESNTYASGKEQVLKGLEKGIFYKEDDESIWADLSEIKLDKKVLLRGDGTSLYITQDIGTAIARQKDWPFTRLIYVVGSEQQYHFRVLFHILQKLGYSWANQLKHLSYGMVNLPDGKMKSREGTVVDADDLIAQLTQMAKSEIREKGREQEVEDLEETAKAIALGALNYYLLQASPGKDMIFNPKESLSFNGNTGPYLQYMGARISSITRKYKKLNIKTAKPDFTLLTEDIERELIKLIIAWPETLKKSSQELNPSVIASFIYELAKTFSRFYHDLPIINNENKELTASRMELSIAVLQVFKNAFRLIGIPFLEKM